MTNTTVYDLNIDFCKKLARIKKLRFHFGSGSLPRHDPGVGALIHLTGQEKGVPPEPNLHGVF